jgi:adenosylhomocysteine nucleosidase
MTDTVIRGALGVLAALPEELGGLTQNARAREVQGFTLHESELAGTRLIACAAGVGKVAATHGASQLIAAGAAGLVVVGTCGALRRNLQVGTLVHCRRTVQADLAAREGRECDPDPAWKAAWQAAVPGPEGWFVTADRPVLSLWRRLRLARAYAGPGVADMETAAAARVAVRAGVPWAALRAVTDLAGPWTAAGFRRNYATQAGRTADMVSELLPHLHALGWPYATTTSSA